MTPAKPGDGDQGPKRSLVAEVVRALESREATDASTLTAPRRSRGVAILSVVVLCVVLYLEWPALSGAQERQQVTAAAIGSLPVIAHMVEDYAAATGRLPDSLAAVGPLDSPSLLYRASDSTYSISLVTPVGDTVTYPGVVHLHDGDRP